MRVTGAGAQRQRCVEKEGMRGNERGEGGRLVGDVDVFVC